jgi:putative Mg2+ transporter-C (MgtC) family protein
MIGIPVSAMILRVLVGAALGGAIGFERDRHGRSAGLRTHLIVALASATFMLVSAHFSFSQNYAGSPGIGVDPSRIAASVVTGIGFLAGGTILKTGLTIHGLTTAAGLWLVAAIGLCTGAGMFTLAFVVTGVGLLALTLFRMFQSKDDGRVRRDISLQLSDGPEVIPNLLDAFSQAGIVVSDFDFKKSPDSIHVKLAFQASFPVSQDVYQFIQMVGQRPEVEGVHIKHPDWGN